ncbi:MAG: tetraacyldisaccharide 4'-kinase [Rhodomicrobium sp.]
MVRKSAPSWWYKEGPIPLAAWGLWPVSAIYGAVAKRRLRRARPYRSALHVICVGNFTMGGAGKTPVALKVAALLKEAGRNPGFLTRGYGGSETGPHLVQERDSADEVGDEPLLLARAAPTVVSRDRPLGARLLQSLDVDAIVMDDGFQNPSLAKDFNIAVVDGGVGLGNGRVFPLGPLRAPLASQLGMADAIVVLGGSGALHYLDRELRSRPLPIFRARIVPLIGDELRERRFVAFCGIGRPAKFLDTLREAGATLVKTRSFPDHHAYTEAEARLLLGEAKALKAALITTEKDAARLKGKPGALGELYRYAAALPIAAQFFEEDEAELSRLLLKAIGADPRDTLLETLPL